MMNKLLNNINTLKIIGLSIIIISIWNRFIRERLPKDLPLTLNNKLFIILLFICLSLLFSLSNIIFNAFMLKKNDNLQIALNTYLKKSLAAFDYHTKIFLVKYTNINFQKLNITILNYVKPKLSKSLFIYIIFMSPKIIVPLILLIDIFHFNQIKYFYLSLMLMTLPLIYQYISYNLQQYYIQQVEAIENVLDISVADKSTNATFFEDLNKDSVHFYIQEHTLERLNVRNNIYLFNVILKTNYINNKLKNKSLAEIENFYEIYCKKVLIFTSKIYEILYTFTFQEKRFGVPLNVFMIITYLFCWTYVLFQANYTHISLTQILNKLQENIEPFSGLFL